MWGRWVLLAIYVIWGVFSIIDLRREDYMFKCLQWWPALWFAITTWALGLVAIWGLYFVIKYF